MIEYSVILRRYEGSTRPDVVIFQDEDREKALKVMGDYAKKHGFSVHDKDGVFTIRTIELVEREPIVDAPVLSALKYHELFDHLGKRRKEDL